MDKGDLKILNIGTDPSVLDKNSKLAGRALEFGALAEKYVFLVPSKSDAQVDVSDKVRAFGVGAGNKFFQLLKMNRKAEEILGKEKFSIITVQDPYYLALVALRLAKKFKIGLQVQVHGWEKLGRLRKVVAKYVLRRVSSVRAVSERLKKQLVSEFGVSEEKITVVPIHSEVQCANFKAQSDRIRENDGRFVFLTVGRLVTVKNIAMQIEAMAEVTKKYPQAELWIAGEGYERKNLEAQSARLKITGNIKFFGWQEKLNDFYGQADAFLLTSDYEGWGLAVLEAAGFGLPIIMTDVGCAGEAIKDGESGLVISVGGKRALIEAMEKLVLDASLRQKLSEGAKKAVDALPSKEEILDRYKESWQAAQRAKFK